MKSNIYVFYFAFDAEGNNLYFANKKAFVTLVLL